MLRLPAEPSPLHSLVSEWASVSVRCWSTTNLGGGAAGAGIGVRDALITITDIGEDGRIRIAHRDPGIVRVRLFGRVAQGIAAIGTIVLADIDHPVPGIGRDTAVLLMDPEIAPAIDRLMEIVRDVLEFSPSNREHRIVRADRIPVGPVEINLVEINPAEVSRALVVRAEQSQGQVDPELIDRDRTAPVVAIALVLVVPEPIVPALIVPDRTSLAATGQCRLDRVILDRAIPVKVARRHQAVRLLSRADLRPRLGQAIRVRTIRGPVTPDKIGQPQRIAHLRRDLHNKVVRRIRINDRLSKRSQLRSLSLRDEVAKIRILPTGSARSSAVAC